MSLGFGGNKDKEYFSSCWGVFVLETDGFLPQVPSGRLD